MFRPTTHLPAAAALLAFASQASSQWTTLVSRTSDGAQTNGASVLASISNDGRFVTYVSSASNIVSDDTNGVDDAFVYDMWYGGTTRVSVNSLGVQGNGSSGFEKPSISDDGRYVVFVSAASNLVPDDTNNHNDVFLRDRMLGVTTRVSVGGSGNQVDGSSQGNTTSADGRYIAFDSDSNQLWPGDANNKPDVFVVDTATGTLTCASVDPAGQPSDRDSVRPALSVDGRWIAFTSPSTNLVPNDTNDTWDAFVRDLASGQTSRVSVNSLGEQANGMTNSVRVAISGDGRYVVFLSLATNLMPNDTNGVQDVFVRDQQTGTTECVSTDSFGMPSNGASSGCSISTDGRYVTYGSYATNLVSGDTNGAVDIFVKDRWTGATTRVTVGDLGQEGNAASNFSRISGDGRLVVFQSLASNLAPGDTNGASDIFVRDWQFNCGPSIGQYCMSLINTTGEGALIDWQGSTSVAQNDLVLKVYHCPPGHYGIYFFGCYQTAVPFGEGVLCVTGEQHRLPILRVDEQGAGSYALDFTDPLSPASIIAPGTQWNFQFWYRDPQPVGHGFNLSNALSAQFCP